MFVGRALWAALFPIVLRDLPSAISAFLERIARRNEKKRPKQIALFLKETGPPSDASPQDRSIAADAHAA